MQQVAKSSVSFSDAVAILNPSTMFEIKLKLLQFLNQIGKQKK